MKRVLIAGATGYLGRYLCAEFQRRGWYVIALVRKGTQAVPIAADQLVEAQATDPMTLKGVMTGLDLVVSCLGLTRPADRQGYWDVDYKANLNLLREAEQAGISRFAYIHLFGASDMEQVPVIAAVNGPAIGAGCDLACMCDIRIGSTGAMFGETFVNLGIIPGDGGAWFLQRLIGYQRAAEMTFTGRVVKADEAVELGLLLEVTEPDALMPRVMEMASTIASKPPITLRYAKRLMKKAQRMELPDFLDLCAVYQGICHNTEDHTEAVGAFLDKREPSFKGR